MTTECPICKAQLEDAELPLHLREEHPDAPPQIEQTAEAAVEHKCAQCGAVLPSAEALADHNLRVHGL
ncbi:MAG TPA: C2H2-type zinc finger protein [Thermoplasmata archaeon]|nr:C2H2-type zinc finger protein [Thermoplasmata archaeon]